MNPIPNSEPHLPSRPPHSTPPSRLRLVGPAGVCRAQLPSGPGHQPPRPPRLGRRALRLVALGGGAPASAPDLRPRRRSRRPPASAPCVPCRLSRPSGAGHRPPRPACPAAVRGAAWDPALLLAGSRRKRAVALGLEEDPPDPLRPSRTRPVARVLLLPRPHAAARVLLLRQSGRVVLPHQAVAARVALADQGRPRHSGAGDGGELHLAAAVAGSGRRKDARAPACRCSRRLPLPRARAVAARAGRRGSTPFPRRPLLPRALAAAARLSRSCGCLHRARPLLPPSSRPSSHSKTPSRHPAPSRPDCGSCMTKSLAYAVQIRHKHHQVHDLINNMGCGID